MLYLNAYAVGRTYGGPEEGGWWYDAGSPLASVPIPSQRKPGCGPHCDNCRAADAGEPFAAYCTVNEAPPEEASHEAPVEGFDVEGEKAKLAALFADEQCPRGRSSAAGGTDVLVYVEDHVAAPFPSERPTFC